MPSTGCCCVVILSSFERFQRIPCQCAHIYSHEVITHLQGMLRLLQNGGVGDVKAMEATGKRRSASVNHDALNLDTVPQTSSRNKRHHGEAGGPIVRCVMEGGWGWSDRRMGMEWSSRCDVDWTVISNTSERATESRIRPKIGANSRVDVRPLPSGSDPQSYQSLKPVLYPQW